jgi:membrane associated rhomboid family serine protease
VTTRVLVLVMLLIAAVVSFTVGPTSDVGVLVRDGAIVRGLVREGEWWRLVSSVFLHVGGIHLLFNATGLWFVGRLAEDMFGAWRTLAIFALAALAGSTASYLSSPVGMSAGASGGLMGIAAAVFAELTLHRKKHRQAWTRGVWGAIGIVTIGQLALGFVYSAMDQWAHGIGLAAGALAGAAMSPNLRTERLSWHAARVIGIAFIVVSIVAAVFVVRTSIADSLARQPLVQRSTTRVTATVPASWARLRDEMYDPDTLVVLLPLRVEPHGTLTEQLGAWHDGEIRRAKDRQFERVVEAPDAVVPLPAGWQGSELIASATDELGTVQTFRVIVAGRRESDSVILASLYVPETLARAAPAYYAAMVASIQPLEE